MLKKLRKNSIIIVIILIFIYATSNAQYQKDIKKDAPPLTEHYIRMSKFESLYTWSIASLIKEPYISELLIDSSDNINFAYYDNILNTVVYVKGKNGKFTKTILNEDREIGNLVSIATNNKHIHIAYNRANKILYANDNGGYFNNFQMYLQNNSKIMDIKLVMSAFHLPTLFFVDNKGVLLVSRFYRDNFFWYCNRRYCFCYLELFT